MLTAEHKIAITKLMFEDIAKYCNYYGDGTYTANVCADLQYNITALQLFETSNNAEQLHDTIVQQDTFVREHFIKVLRYIEKNNLIASKHFVCR